MESRETRVLTCFITFDVNIERKIQYGTSIFFKSHNNAIGSI